MIIAACRAFLFELPLLYPLTIGQRVLRSRRGLIIRLSTADHHSGYGEAAPLPGFHREDLEAVLSQYRDLQPQWIGRELPEALAKLDGGFEAWLGNDDLLPSLRYGLEMAILNLLANRRRCPLAALLASAYPKRLPVCGLVMATADHSQPHDSRTEFSAVKLKVGRGSPEDDIEAIRLTRRMVGNGVSLRLDANRSWDLETAVGIGWAVADCAIEYIEEPLADPSLLSHFHALTSISVALDESLSEQHPASFAIPPGVRALILKPAVLGGLEKMNAYISLARRHAVKAIVSSAFDSGVGLAALANCAASLTQGRYPAGLDTYRWLCHDLLAERLSYRATIDVDQAHAQAQRLRLDLLTEI